MLTGGSGGVNTIRRMSRGIAFLTGGTGFVGGHVARALGSEGWSVRALARRPEALAGSSSAAAAALDVVAGDLSDRSAQTLRDALRGCRAIVHVAGLVKARSLEEYREGNVCATERLLRAGNASSPGAVFVLVSSQAAAGPARQGRPVREQDVPRPVSWYGLSKLEGEAAVAREWKGPWIVLRPSVVYGPGDRGLLTFFAAAARGWVPVPVGEHRIQLIHASRAALGIARAAGRPDLAGRTGFLSDPEPVRVRDLARSIARLPERPARLVPIPSALVRAAGAFETLREAMTRVSRPFNADKAREILAGDWLCEPVMQAHLSLPPASPLDDGLREAWNWYRREGWLAL
jgi:nucleoside-diphosphate-sugar epimerase